MLLSLWHCGAPGVSGTIWYRWQSPWIEKVFAKGASGGPFGDFFNGSWGGGVLAQRAEMNIPRVLKWLGQFTGGRDSVYLASWDWGSGSGKIWYRWQNPVRGGITKVFAKGAPGGPFGDFFCGSWGGVCLPRGQERIFQGFQVGWGSLGGGRVDI
jgi:hypothetical protein